MAIEIKLPALGENLNSGTVVKLLVSAGDTVTKDQPIMELETEKASVEVPSSASGTVGTIRVKEGDTIEVGQVILTLEEGGEASGKAATAKEKPEPKAEDAAAKKKTRPEAPPEKPSSSEAGEDETPAEPAARQQAEPPKRVRKEEKEKVPEQPEGKEEELEPAVKTADAEEDQEVAPAAPSLRRTARELGIDINAVSGTGPGGRITEEDVRNYARSIILNASGPGTAVQPPPASPDFSRWGEIERKPMTGIRKKTAEHVHQAWASIPHVTQFDFADITELDQLRKSFAKKAEDAGAKLTVTAILLKVSAAALKVFPQFNVSLDMAQGEIVFKKYYHIGVAVDTEHGLLVPVIRDVDKKNILDLSIELAKAGEKARERKLGIEEMQGGSFTITNLGGIGGTNFTPIVNSPEVAILGISRASYQPVYTDGQFQPRLILPLSLSYDHRAIDGAAAARFLRWVAEALQEPFMLALEG